MLLLTTTLQLHIETRQAYAPINHNHRATYLIPTGLCSVRHYLLAFMHKLTAGFYLNLNAILTLPSTNFL